MSRHLVAAGMLLVLLSANTWASETSRVEQLRSRLDRVDDNYVMVAAHRGDWRNAPENSLQAIKNCIEMGADMVEIDVRKTKDGHLVLLHDETLDRTTTGSGPVHERTLDELRELRLRNGQGVPTRHTIPTLEEAMQLAKGRILIYLDKTEAWMPETLAVLRSTGTTREGIFYGSQSLETLRQTHGDLIEQVAYMPSLKDSIPDLTSYAESFANHPSTVAWVTKFEDERSPALAQAKELRAKGHHIWVGTLWPEQCGGHDDDSAVDNPDAAWGWVIEQGGTIICTDRPKLLLEYLRARGLHD